VRLVALGRSASGPPEILEPTGGKFAVADCLLNVLPAEVML
jgi:hypothetical protein